MSASKPNIVIIMTDQQQAGLCRREGYALDTTPYLDSLAAEGTWFSRAYTSMPVSLCARVSMLTGRYPSATHARTNYNTDDVFAKTDMFRYFRQQGYCAGLAGKNHSHVKSGDADFWYAASHLGAADPNPNLPTECQEFDRFLREETHSHFWPEPTSFPLHCQLPYRIVDQAQHWISGTGERPFFLWMSFPEPHNPYQVCEPYFSMFPPESLPALRAGSEALATKGFPYQWCRESFERAFPGYADSIGRARSNYHGTLRMIDDQVARFVDFLQREGKADNTIFVFLSDHGDFVGEYGLTRKGPELPELLTRIPLLFRGPGIERRGLNLAHVSIADLFPTLCEAMGAEIPEGVQGRSLWPLLTGQSYPANEFRSAYAEHGFGGLPYSGGEELNPEIDGFKPGTTAWGRYDCLNSRTQSGITRMVRMGDWKLSFDVLGRGQLYHLPDDPVELRNLFAQPEAAVKRQELTEELLTWMLRVQDPLPVPGVSRGRQYKTKTLPHNYWSAQHS